jgi:hypothetical protein
VPDKIHALANSSPFLKYVLKPRIPLKEVDLIHYTGCGNNETRANWCEQRSSKKMNFTVINPVDEYS